jgi:hypothetical protein
MQDGYVGGREAGVFSAGVVYTPAGVSTLL